MRFPVHGRRQPAAPKGLPAVRRFACSFASVALVSTIVVSTALAAPFPTTRNDFDLPGTQPLSVNDDFSTPDTCAPCHSGYGQPSVEPVRNWSGSMMAQSGRDPMMWAALAIANQDLQDSGETCLRCHLPKGWLEGRSVPEDGTQMTAADREGVQCTICHRMVDPFAGPGHPVEDDAILAALTQPVTVIGGAQMVVDPEERLRGPFDVVADNGFEPHGAFDGTLISPYHQSSELCGTCHNVINPIFTRDGGGEYVLNALDTPGDPALGFPEQSTYDEWAASEYATTGVFAPQFGGNLATVSTCQDCHMPDVSGKDADGAVSRDNVPLHSMLGGNTFIPKVLSSHPAFGSEVDPNLLAETAEKNTEYLRKSATVSASIDGGNLTVRVQNETGHKLPTGYPEGRRMWLHVRAFDADRAVVLESGRYVFSTATLTGYGAIPSDPDYDADLHVWEAIHGLSPAFATTLGRTAGPSAHLALNNVREFDNRIPPRGFTNAGFAAFDGHPVGQAFADGEFWDDVVYPVGPQAVEAEVVLFYQTASREYIEFLRDENVTTAAGNILFDLWDLIDRSTPVEMARVYVQTDADTVATCNQNISKQQAKFAKRYAKEWARCYSAEASGSACDAPTRDAKIASAEAKMRQRIGGLKDSRCSGENLTPASIGHAASCPFPCSAVTVFGMTDLATCAVCLSEALHDEGLESVYGVAPPALPADAPPGSPGVCQKTAAKAVSKLAGSWAKALSACADDNLTGANNPVLDCSTDPDGDIAKAMAKAAKKLSKCTDLTGLAGCLASGTAPAAQACIEANIGAVAPPYVQGAYP